MFRESLAHDADWMCSVCGFGSVLEEALIQTSVAGNFGQHMQRQIQETACSWEEAGCIFCGDLLGFVTPGPSPQTERRRRAQC